MTEELCNKSNVRHLIFVYLCAIIFDTFTLNCFRMYRTYVFIIGLFSNWTSYEIKHYVWKLIKYFPTSYSLNVCVPNVKYDAFFFWVLILIRFYSSFCQRRRDNVRDYFANKDVTQIVYIFRSDLIQVLWMYRFWSLFRLDSILFTYCIYSIRSYFLW